MIGALLDWRHWIYGLTAAVIGSAANTIAATLGAGAIGDPLNMGQIWTIAITSAILGAAMYLKQSPLPAVIETKTETKKVEVTTETKTETKSQNEKEKEKEKEKEG